MSDNVDSVLDDCFRSVKSDTARNDVDASIADGSFVSNVLTRKCKLDRGDTRPTSNVRGEFFIFPPLLGIVFVLLELFECLDQRMKRIFVDGKHRC